VRDSRHTSGDEMGREASERGVVAASLRQILRDISTREASRRKCSHRREHIINERNLRAFPEFSRISATRRVPKRVSLLLSPEMEFPTPKEIAVKFWNRCDLSRKHNGRNLARDNLQSWRATIKADESLGTISILRRTNARAAYPD